MVARVRTAAQASKLQAAQVCRAYFRSAVFTAVPFRLV